MDITEHGIIRVDGSLDGGVEFTEARQELSAEEAERRGLKCECVSNHNPNPQELHWHHIWPLGEGGPDTKANLVLLCPNTHANIHVLLRAYKKYGGRPPYEITKYFSRFAQSYAALAWKQIEESKVITR